MRKLRDSSSFKRFMAFVGLTVLFQVIFPTVSWALTTGPAQEEFASFEPATTTDMVDLSSGDFTYNIPLLSVPGPNGGYPINLSYHSGIGMEQEASWVGLGWNINVGAVNRQLRGLPDDFDGDEIVYDYDYRDNITVGINGPKSDNDKIHKKEFFGFPPFNSSSTGPNTSFDWQIYYNSFKGLGYRVMLTSIPETDNKFGLGMGLTIDSQNGIGITPSISLNAQFNGVGYQNKLSATVNNRQGLTDVGFSSSLQITPQRSSIKNIAFQGVGSNSSLSFSTSHNVPKVSLPFNTTSTPFNISVGTVEAFGDYESKFPAGWSGYYNQTVLANNGIVTAPGYGYLNTQNDTLKIGVRDFSRNPLEYSEKIPNLASSNYTYDLFTYSGQGAGGMFRPYRSTVEVLTDQYRVNRSTTEQKNIEAGAGPGLAHLGYDFPSENSTSESGSWNDGTDQLNLSKPDNDAYEYAYFQEYGEKTGFIKNTTEDQLSNWEGDEAVMLKLEKSGGWIGRKFFVNNKFTQSSSSLEKDMAVNNRYAKNQNGARQRRGKVIHQLTYAQAKEYGLSKNLKYFDVEEDQAVDKFNTSNVRPAHHISEIEVVEPDGMRYVYGLPAYNNTQIDETMATPASSSTGTTPVSEDTNEDTDNQYRSKTTLPAYVHSWMLTAVFSTDYVDRTGDGPSEDDLGYYTQFNYEKRYDDYKWRLPYQEGSFIEGTKSETDNMVAYTYGKKEIYFLQSIETKTHIAEFDLTPREDGLEAFGQYAGATAKGSKAMHKLKGIKLYAKNEKADAVQHQRIPVPIKSVNFTYDYTLCTGIPNSSNGAGKLTLKELSFTYQNSTRGELSPYHFNYENANPNYDRTKMDRWGNYKPKSGYRPSYPAEVFPYNDQKLDDQDAAPWHLTSIELPTGGTLNIEYEEDDYSYVEGEKPMKMFDIVGAREDALPPLDNTGFISDKYHAQAHQDMDAERIYFALEKPILDNNILVSPSVYVKTNYFNDSTLSKIWYKALIDIKNGHKDYVSGYADVDYSKDFGLDKRNSSTPTGSYDVGYFYVKNVDIAKMTPGSIHPFRKAAFQHLQLQRPELLYGPTVLPTNPFLALTNFIPAIFTNLTDLIQMSVGFNNYCKLAGFGKTIHFGGESIVKLYDENQIKNGGGSRVKRLAINDNWDNDEDGTLENAEYGQAYDYTLANGLSSGVAYEPRIGGEESALRKPVDYSESIPLNTTRSLFVEQPILENYYPGAQVTYSHVTVRSIAPELAEDENNNNKLFLTAAPITEYAFYTAKDFPVKVDETDISNDPDILRPLLIPGIYTNFKKKRARSQGYSIILNDMTGKPKSITQRTKPTFNNPAGKLISKEEYIYQTQSPYNANQPNYLDNVVKGLNEDGSYTEVVIGQSHDIFIDMNENKMSSKSRNIAFNLEWQAPIQFAPIPIPYFGDVELSTKTVVTNKIIHRTGIIKEVITTTGESTIKQENLAYDINSGAPLLTQVTNEYKDPIYTHNIPAYWQYTGMEGAYQNIDYTEKYSTARTIDGVSELTVDNINLYHLGDEVGIEGSFTGRAFVVGKNATKIKLRSYCQYLPNKTVDAITVVRSGHRNMLTANSGSVISKAFNLSQSTPINMADLYKDNQGNTQVIDANATEYKDQWQFNPCLNLCIESSDDNPYTNGLSGNWRFYKSHKYVNDRVYAGANNNGNQTDGVYASFEQFNWATLVNPAWLLANEVTRYSPHGYEVESRDALNNYSSARYGYNSALNTAVAYNARQMEIGNNDFEQGLNGCTNYLDFGISPTKGEGHTGNHALVINPATTGIENIPIVSSTDPILATGYQPSETAKLQLIEGKKYIISTWAKEYAGGVAALANYTSPNIQITNAGSAIPSLPNHPLPFTPKGNIIEGWQRIEYEFEVPIGASQIEVNLNTSALTGFVLFDDIRIYPADGQIKTFVYDPISLKLAAELDENNYATYYIYDERGSLSKVKKETERGIKTITEGRSSTVKD